MIWIIGAGLIAQEYAKILTELHIEYKVIGNSKDRAKKFEAELRHEVIIGGVEKYILKKSEIPQKAIIAVPTSKLAGVTISLINYGVKEILCEKPGFQNPSELNDVLFAANMHQSKVFYAYNRRFFSSTLKAEEIIRNDGGIISFNFEFTEWPDRFCSFFDDTTLRFWFYENSTHVVDLAFFLGGFPSVIKCFTAGKLEWHNPAIFAGAGISEKGAIFNYHANWAAPGRWAVEILTKKHRLYFKPMETLQIQEKNSVQVNPVEIDNTLDQKFKPGFFLETKAFVEGKTDRLCTLKEQFEHLKNVYSMMCNPCD